MNGTVLKKRVSGAVLRPDDAGYDNGRAGWNQIVDQRPNLIVMATSAADVAAAVDFAAEVDLPIAVQATGHGPAAPIEGGVLVNTRQMTGCAVDPDRGTATFGPGVTWAPVMEAAAPHGLSPLVGTCVTVGATGYLTGGGLPALARRYGFAADHVRSMDVVTADGQIRQVSAESEPDLFWAIRGGKGNFGIVTSVETDLVPLSRVYGGGLFFPGEAAGAVLTAWREWTVDQTQAMCSSVALTRFPDLPAVPAPFRGKLLAHIRIAYAGGVMEGEHALQPLRALKPIADTVADIPASKIGEIFLNPAQAAPVRDRGILLNDIDAATITAIVNLAGPDAALPPGSVEVRHLGGAIAKAPAVPNAVGHRDAPYNLMVGMLSLPEQREQVESAQQAIFDAVARWSSGAIFPNFLGSNETSVDQVRMAYTEQDYARLQRLKTIWDPANRFRLNHNIPPHH